MSVILFLLVLSVLVLIHEAGHYFAARIFGVKADEFGYGFPPRLIGYVKDKGKWKKVGRNDRTVYKNTIWSINWLPLGGFVKIKGETTDGMNDPDSIHAKPIWQRLLIIAAGVGMNWVLAVVLFMGVFLAGTTVMLDGVPKEAIITDRQVIVTQIVPGSPAEQAGIIPGDILRRVEGKVPQSWEDARNVIQSRGTDPVEIEYEHEGAVLIASVIPVQLKELNRPGVGLGMGDVGHVKFTFVSAFTSAVQATWTLTKTILFTFAEIVHDLFVKRAVTQEVSGPVGIAVMTGKIAKQGFVPLLQFAAMLSVNLAVINFLPIPALDGGRAMFLILEAIRRKPISRTLEIGIHNVAFVLLITLILLVTAHDVSKYGGAIMGGVRGIFGY
jgi:regulator of sigma E protease